jgi:hypothetical protein
MVHIQPKQYEKGLAVKMMFDVAIAADLINGCIAFALFSSENKKVFEDSIDIDADYIKKHYKDYNVAVNKVAKYLGVVLI